MSEQLQLDVPLGRYGSKGPCDGCAKLATLSTDGPNERWLCRACRAAAPVRACKYAGCAAPIVGHSITGEGHVCGRHNVEEWGRSLSRNREPYYRGLGQRLLKEAAA